MALIRWKDGRWWPSWRRAFAPAGRPELGGDPRHAGEPARGDGARPVVRCARCRLALAFGIQVQPPAFSKLHGR
eukprot:5075757-Prymnesium_polylepis.1